MKTIREQFEEIWPVPDVIMWSEYIGRYIPMRDEVLQYERLNEQWAHEHNARLDTFTRCQETFVASLPERMEMQPYQTVDRGSTNYKAGFNACLKQIMEQKK